MANIDPQDFAEVTPLPKPNGKAALRPAHEVSPDAAKQAAPMRLGDLLEPSLERVERRASGKEKPVPLPWEILAPHFGGGLWQGVHYVAKSTGIGGTQLALQLAIHAARSGFPALYVGLEMGGFDLGVRTLGLDAGVPWSQLWTGKAGPAYVARARESVASLRDLPIFVEVARPMGYSSVEIAGAVERVRALYPGEQAILVVVDFLQLVGDAPGESQELRQRIANAAYMLREIAVRLNAAVLCISSVAREKLKLLSDIVQVAGLTWEEDEDECPINRRILDPDAIVGLGKESGEIEYSGDSVSVLARVPGTWDGSGCDVIFASSKGRATGPMWSPLRFTGHEYTECDDRGGRMLEAWKAAANKREAQREERRADKERKKETRLDADARAIAAYVLTHQGCTVRDARACAVANNYRRWAPAVARLGAAFVQSDEGLAINADKLKPEHQSDKVGGP